MTAPGRGASSAARARVTWLGHATVLLEIGGTRIITDPVLRDRMGMLRRRRDLPAPEPSPPIDAVLLSHLHHDHADLPTLRRIGETQVLAEVANARWLRRHGLVAPSLDPTAWRQVTDDVRVRLVPAVHAARPMPHRPNGAVGMLVRGAGVIVWFAGDTALYPGMADLPEIAGAPIDLALLPIGGWGPRLSAGHMGPEDAAEAAALADASTVVPIHYGTLHPRGWPAGHLDWMTAPGERLPIVLADRSNASAQVIPVGGTLTLR